MAKSRTKKSNKTAIPPEIANEINQVTDYIKHWTLHEIHRIQSSAALPVCIPIKNGYRIGLYTLRVHKTKKCDVLDPNHELVHTFEDKRSAVLYTIYTIKRKYKTADTILSLDIEIKKNYADVLAWRNHIATARKKQEYDIADIRQSRLEIAEKTLEHARDQISKIYITAKYNKIWDL